MHPPWAAPARAAFVLDLRSLALFRVLLAAAMLADGLSRLGSLRSFWTDAGVLPRVLLTQIGDPARLSLHMIGGAFAVQLLLWTLHMLASAALLVGWRTRATAAIAFVLTVSVAARNPWAQTPGEALQVLLLFFAMFAPLGARWSFDAATSATPRPADASATPGGAALLLQAALAPAIAAVAQSGLAWRVTHTAAADAFALSTYAQAFGHWLLAAAPAALPALSAALWWGQLAIPFGVLSPLGQPYGRRLALLLYLFVNVGLMLTLRAGSLSWVGLAAAALLVDGRLWDAIVRRHLRRQPQGRLRLYHGDDSSGARGRAVLLREMLALPAADVLPASASARVERLLDSHRGIVVIDRDDAAHRDWDATVVLLRRSPLFWPLAPFAAIGPGRRLGNRWAARAAARDGKPAEPRTVAFESPLPVQRAALALSLIVVLAQLSTAGDPARLPAAIRMPLAALGLDRGIRLLAPAPPLGDRWLVIDGEREDGREVDVAHGHPGPPAFSEPKRPTAYRWQIYAERIADDPRPALRDAWAERLCRAWNAAHPTPAEGVRRIRLVMMVEQSHAAEPEQHVLVRHECGAGLAGTLPPIDE